MAAAEARAAWQRANRYFVQEDAKRAPKLACCQNTNSSSKLVDIGPVNATDHSDHLAAGFMPFSRVPSHSNLPQDAKWWLQMQPDYFHHKGSNIEQPNPRKGFVESSPSVAMDSDSPVAVSSTYSEDSIRTINFEDLESFLDVKKHPEKVLEELDVMDSKVDQDLLDVKNMTDYYDLLEMEMVGSSVSKQSSDFSSKADSSWIGADKVPWWRVADEGELASFVAQKSLDHIENCDLPPPQKMRLSSELGKQSTAVDSDEIFMSSFDCAPQTEAFSSPSSAVSPGSHWSSMKGLSRCETIATEALRTNNNNMAKKGRNPIHDPGKAKLLEALCHSQTRAREAEKAAKQAYCEKEHILKLFFRQASQLLAYKQWFKMLQLENLLLQTGNNNSSSPLTAFPELIPWMPPKPRKLHKNEQKFAKAKRHKRGSKENVIGKYAVAFAVGFTLVGAGLILGWTVGWLLPAL